jgi:hypothetical protein
MSAVDTVQSKSTRFLKVITYYLDDFSLNEFKKIARDHQA